MNIHTPKVRLALMIIFLIAILCHTTKAQDSVEHFKPFIGLSYFSHSAGAELGYMAKNKLELTLKGVIPFSSILKPTILSLAVGKQLTIDKSYKFTPSIGIALYKIADLTSYNDGTRSSPEIIRKRPLYLNVQLSKMMNTGSIFFNTTYTLKVYCSFGIRYYYNRTKYSRLHHNQ